jgi:hypothetical protein
MTDDAHMNKTLDGAHYTRHSAARAPRSNQHQQASAQNTSASGPSAHAYSTRTAQRLWVDADDSTLDVSSMGNNTTMQMASSR